MDPQKLSQLDPKLRDAYQRVMGTTIPEPQAAPAQAQTPPMPTPPMPDPTPAPQPQPEPEPTSVPTPTIQEPPTAPAEPPVPTPETPMPQQSPVQATNFDQMNSEVAATPMPQAQTMVVKKKNSMMPILIGIAGLIFIAFYTLFWTKIFNFKLPFLP